MHTWSFLKTFRATQIVEQNRRTKSNRSWLFSYATKTQPQTWFLSCFVSDTVNSPSGPTKSSCISRNMWQNYVSWNLNWSEISKQSFYIHLYFLQNEIYHFMRNGLEKIKLDAKYFRLHEIRVIRCHFTQEHNACNTFLHAFAYCPRTTRPIQLQLFPIHLED